MESLTKIYGDHHAGDQLSAEIYLTVEAALVGVIASYTTLRRDIE